MPELRNPGAPGRRRGAYAPRGEDHEDDKTRTTVRLPRGVRAYLERKAERAGVTFQLQLERVLTQVMIEDDEEEGGIAPADLDENLVAPPLLGTDSGVRGAVQHAPGVVSLPELAEVLNITTRTAQNWSHDETFPAGVGKRRKAILYERAAVLKWVEGRKGLVEAILPPISELVRKEALETVGLGVEALVSETPGIQLDESALERLAERVAEKLGGAGNHFKAAL
jgi:hypothetical protein